MGKLNEEGAERGRKESRKKKEEKKREEGDKVRDSKHGGENGMGERRKDKKNLPLSQMKKKEE